MQGEQVKANEHDAKSPSTRTGRLAALVRLLGLEGSGAPSRPLRSGLLCAFILTVAVAALPAGASAAYVKASPEALCTGAGTAAGPCVVIRGVAVDQSNGNVYLLDLGNLRIDEFDATGQFVRAFGVDVGGTGVNVCTTVCQMGTTVGAGAITTGARGLAVDSSTHIVYAVSAIAKVAYYEGDGTFLGEFEGDTNTSPPAPAKISASGVAVDESSPQHYLYVASGNVIDKFKVPVASGGTVTSVPAYECQITGKAPAEKSSSECDPAGSQDGAFNGISFTGQKGGDLAVDSAGNVYAAEQTGRGVVSEFSSTGTFVRATSVAAPVAVTAPTPEHLVVVGGGTANGGTQLQERETSTGAVLAEVTLEGASLGTATYRQASGLKGRLYAGGTQTKNAWVFREVVEVTPVVEIEPATDASATGVQLNGTVTVPTFEGEAVPTGYWFEYSANGGNTWSAEAERSAGEAPGPVAVSQRLSGLLPNTSYQARLCATTAAGSRCENTKVTAASSPIGFTTSAAPPQVEEVQASFATETSVELEATINPSGSATTYRFEWGASVLYGHRVPVEFEPFAGSGHESIRATATLTGLSPGSVYYYRVVATSSAGSTSVAQEAETLNACGLTDYRCFELVSRADKGPVASPGKATIGSTWTQFQAAPVGSALAYTVESGYPDASSGFEPVYLARRAAHGWESEQVDPPGGTTSALSAGLGCAVVSSQALAAGAPPTVVEGGGVNLYVRDNASGSYEAITSLPPVGAFAGGFRYEVIGVSSDCGRVVFRTPYRYPGIPVAGGAEAKQLYEWDHGTIRNVAVIPGPGGTSEPVLAESLPGALDENVGTAALGTKSTTNTWRAVSEDGSRSIFTALSQFGGDLGKRAIFLRDTSDPAVLVGSAPAIDISQSETATPNNGNSHYWIASTDGRRIFFTARYGLAADGSSSAPIATCANAAVGSSTGASGEGCDLYEFDLDKPAGERLTDLSPDLTDPKGAGVVGVLDASESGEYVYFAARGRLGAGGRTEAESLASSTYNVYLAHAGSTTFVGTLGEAEAGTQGQALVANMGAFPWTSQASSDGRFLVLESSLGVAGGSRMAYLFSAQEDATVCVSCRHDGKGPFPTAGSRFQLLVSPVLGGINRVSRPTALTDGGRLYFYSADPLASNSVEGRRNLYQWEHGQVSLIATEPEGVAKFPLEMLPNANFFGGASADGGDVYFTSPSALTGSDKDERWDIYDARVGGGFPEPLAPSPCDAGAEGSCNGAPVGTPTQVTPSTPGFVGPGNPKAEAKPKHHKKKHHKKKHHKRHGKTKHHKRAGKAGRANGDRRVGK
jgi:hypothetical protein